MQTPTSEKLEAGHRSRGTLKVPVTSGASGTSAEELELERLRLNFLAILPFHVLPSSLGLGESEKSEHTHTHQAMLHVLKLQSTYAA